MYIYIAIFEILDEILQSYIESFIEILNLDTLRYTQFITAFLCTP